MRLILAAIAVAAAPAAWAQTPETAPACKTMDFVLPGNLGDWNGKAPVVTAAGAGDLTSAKLLPGKGYEAALKRKGDVAFKVEPEKPGGSVSYSGLFQFDVAKEDNYAIALGNAAWIDVLEDGKALEPLSFGHGPECTTIRKIVIYKLQPGPHTLQVAGSGAETVKLLVGR
jgi:hypothetical protein